VRALERSFILEAIAAEMSSGVLVLDSDATVLYASPFFLKSFPIEGGVMGTKVGEIIGNPALNESVRALIRSSDGGAAAKETEEIEIDEGLRCFNVRLVPLTDDGAFYLLLFLNDITEEKRVETIKKDFVANVSHELRTPLASIKGYSETILDGGIEDLETHKEFLGIIDRNATRMSRIIDDLLILSRLESQEMSIVSTCVDLTELLYSTKKSFEKQAKDKGIDITAGIDRDLPKIWGDRDRLEQVVVNLLDNAIKYTPSGGVVTLKAKSSGEGVLVDVVDTGIGIPEADIPRIFERFYRVDKARSRELGGTGLGLAIVKHIVQAHNGTMRVKSTPGKGSTFSFSVFGCLPGE
jgi:two-component system phosphate regulon sensor histidine kinase PhoR